MSLRAAQAGERSGAADGTNRPRRGLGRGNAGDARWRRSRHPDGTDLYVNDWGQGRAVVLIHGWPLDADMWSDQALFLAEHGCRVVAYDPPRLRPVEPAVGRL